ncbi:hypothetical protein MKJ04_03045 [Pontibacter sp. E15-1]|uniref:hypothetical protein n=1 Tax=Pontibacter sp. E15-1 TaxID=2919918 RepID=UPI001F4F6CFC|nr:hypothetical protein [Pontibacter sp. E15-1]MCJ8163802.1 hypothetical protein [Pontibacter sp. E15-1]
MFEVVRSLFESDRKTNFVALGTMQNDSNSYHSAFVIQYDKNLSEFHYTGSSIELEGINHDYYHKITNTIHPDEVPSFIAQCLNIIKKANPKYGYFYAGESYNSDGIHFSNNDLGQRMTCVGFCLNVLKGFLEEDYIEYSDWEENSHDEENYLEKFCARNGISPEKVAPFHRRITPKEILASGFFVSTPIKKSQIDAKLSELQEKFNSIFSTQ